MIKKFPAKLVGYRPKSIILKSESSPKHSFKNQYLKAEQVGKKRFDEIFDPDNNTWESIKMKYIKSKRFKKGLPTGVSGKDIGWAPQEPSSLAQKKYYAITQSKQENIFKSGRGYFDVKSQSFKYRPKKKK